ncbi:homeobox protein 5 [Drosophila innubila]|uniref:homeobox protein 5 n=1 Tax=Drosophila innubila TaxID=198719 RepID=UPI00148CD4CB|nr:homeobox protein 5 [Drosophila innubila]
MARKDDPVFNVKFVELVEKQACLWNYTHPGYSKKEEVQKAWQHVANEIKDTVRNSRERWRTIRSSFLRSLKLARTQTGRGKRKYYLSKYLQFLIPYTKSRACHKQMPPNAHQNANATSNSNCNPNPNPNSNTNPHPNPNGGMVLRKPSTSTTAATFLATLSTQPMTRIGQMRHHSNANANAIDHDEDTKDSNDSDAVGVVAAAAATVAQPLEVQVSEEEQDQQDNDNDNDRNATQTPLRLQAIKVEHQQHHQQQNNDKIVAAAAAQHSLVTLPVTMAAALRNNLDWTELTEWLKGNSNANQLQFHHLHHNNNNNSSSLNHNNMLSHHGHIVGTANTPPPTASTPAPASLATSGTGAGLGSATVAGTPPDADYSFLISLHPYLKEMSGKQNRRFKQKVVGLIDNVLDNVDV